MNLTRFPKRVEGELDCSGNPVLACDAAGPEPGRSCIRIVQGGSVRCCCEATSGSRLEALSS
jgi:hypothetical protein